MRHELRLLLTALTFLTRVPVARWSYPDAASLAQSARYFPLVGVLVGAAGALSYALARGCFPATLAATLAVLVMIASTGAFHEDGLADTMDGFGGGFSVERKLEIMKDSRIGTYGGIALVLALLLKVNALAALSPGQALPALLAAHLLARWSSQPLTLALPYVRIGSNKPMADALGIRELLLASLWVLGMLLGLALLPTWSLALSALVLGSCVVFTLLAGAFCQAQIGGITGDTLGASNQAVEIGVLLTVLASHA